MTRKYALLIVALILFHNRLALAGESALWLVYNYNEFDYFQDGNSPLAIDGSSAGYSYAFNQQWEAGLGYSEMEGDGAWPRDDIDASDLINRAELESELAVFSLGWQGERFGLSFALSQAEYSERSLTFRPFLLEVIEGEERFFSLGYDDYLEFDPWILSWSIGVQFANREERSRQLYSITPLVVLDTQLGQRSRGSFIEVDISRWFDYESFSWSPQLMVSWNREVYTDDAPQTVLNYRGERRVITQLNDARVNTFRAPGAGYLEISAIIQWRNRWSASAAFGRSVSTLYPVKSLAIDFSVVF